jgi:hypothetical protein
VIKVFCRALVALVFFVLPHDVRLLAAAAQQGAPEPVPSAGPQLPVAPEVITRAEGQTIVRVVRLTTPLRVDGRLDEEVYGATQAISAFIQTVPDEGQPSTERTDAWVLYDDNFIYVSGRCWESDSAP